MRLEMIIGANARQRCLIDGEEVPDDDFVQALGLISGHSSLPLSSVSRAEAIRIHRQDCVGLGTR